MRSIQVKITVGEHGEVKTEFSEPLPAGEHVATVVVSKEHPKPKAPRFRDFPGKPDPSLGSLRREEMYGEDGR